MKSCPKCGRTYADDSLVFCLEDGATLSAPYDPNATLHLPNSKTKPHDSNATFEFPSRETIQPRQRKSNLSWWLLGASGIVIFGLVSLLALFVFLSFTPTRNVNQPADSNQPRAKNSPTPNSSETEETEATLRVLSDDIASAFERADVDFLQRYLANDYLFQDDRGTRTTKTQIIVWLRTGIISYESIKASNVNISVEANKQRAILTGYGELRWRFNGQPYSDQFNFTNLYEKRGGVWQLVSITARH